MSPVYIATHLKERTTFRRYAKFYPEISDFGITFESWMRFLNDAGIGGDGGAALCDPSQIFRANCIPSPGPARVMLFDGFLTSLKRFGHLQREGAPDASMARVLAADPRPKTAVLPPLRSGGGALILMRESVALPERGPPTGRRALAGAQAIFNAGSGTKADAALDALLSARKVWMEELALAAIAAGSGAFPYASDATPMQHGRTAEEEKAALMAEVAAKAAETAAAQTAAFSGTALKRVIASIGGSGIYRGGGSLSSSPAPPGPTPPQLDMESGPRPVPAVLTAHRLLRQAADERLARGPDFKGPFHMFDNVWGAREAFSLGPEHALYFELALAGVLLSLGESGPAHEVLSRTRKWERELAPEHPYHSAAYMAKGLALYYEGEFDKALEMFEDAATLCTNRGTRAAASEAGAAKNNMGCCHYSMGDRRRAVQCLRDSHALIVAAVGAGHPRGDLPMHNASRIQREGSRSLRYYRPPPNQEDFDLASSLSSLIPLKKDAKTLAEENVRLALIKAAAAAAAPPKKEAGVKASKEADEPKKKKPPASTTLLPPNYGGVQA